MQYDALGRVVATTSTLGSFTYDYSPATDQLTKITSSFGHIQNFSYKGVLDDLNLSQIENLSTTGSLLSRFTYNHDVVGRITQWGQKQNASAAAPDSYDMKYDSADRLIEALKTDAAGNGKQWNWRYDKTDNRLNEQVETFTASTDSVSREEYTVNIADQVTSTISGGKLHIGGGFNEQGFVTYGGTRPKTFTDPDTTFSAWLDASSSSAATVNTSDWGANTSAPVVHVNPAQAATHTFIGYDANGNMTTVTTTPPGGFPETTVYKWYANDRLAEIAYDDGYATDFVYDSQGRLVWIVEKDDILEPYQYRWFVWDGLKMAEERNDSQHGPPSKLYYDQGEVRLEDGEEAGKYIFTRDHLASVREVTDDFGRLVAKYYYDSFGNISRVEGSNDFDRRFNGYFYHPKSGLYFAPYRVYAPKLGRWLSQDPLGQSKKENLSSFVENNPINLTDPLGLCSKGECLQEVLTSLQSLYHKLIKEHSDDIQSAKTTMLNCVNSATDSFLLEHGYAVLGGPAGTYLLPTTLTTPQKNLIGVGLAYMQLLRSLNKALEACLSQQKKDIAKANKNFDEHVKWLSGLRGDLTKACNKCCEP